MTLAASKYKGFERAFCIRMKSTLTKRGCHFKSAGYRVSFASLEISNSTHFASNRKIKKSYETN